MQSVSPEVSARMSRIRKKDTKPELKVRKAAHALGLRFRLHRSDLPGTPDLVFPGRRVALFVHGCFWHQHGGPACPLVKLPRSRLDYWIPKLERNKARDTRVRTQLSAAGWRVVEIWECEARDPLTLEARLLGQVASIAPQRTRR
jgi:DNA mismatch endonuclease (patch repair protein)